MRCKSKRTARSILLFVLAAFIATILGCGGNTANTPPPAPHPAVVQHASPAKVQEQKAESVPAPAKETPPPAAIDPSKKPAPEAKERVTVSYIGNRRSHIFHRAGCHYVRRMNEGNKVGFDNREEAISKGYRPCLKCCP